MHYRAFGRRVGNVVRLAEIIQVLVRHGFVNLVRRSGLPEGLPARALRALRGIEKAPDEPETFGLRLRKALTELGPSFVKLGQVLSTRPDLVPPDVVQELARLQDQVEPRPFEVMAPVIEEDLGAPIEELFGSFNTQCIAAASLSQVYRATLKTGRPVAVKVRRPGIEEVIQSDLSLLQDVAAWIEEHAEDLTWIDPVGIVDEFGRAIRREMNFTIEARIIDRFRENFAAVPEVLVPKTYRTLCSRRVLTMDWVEGVRIDALDQYAERQSSPKKTARTGCDVLCQQVFEHGLFHADPHPGNIWLTRNNQIAFLDYGMVGHIERTDTAAIADLLRSIFEHDAASCLQTVLLLVKGGEPENVEALERELGDFMAFEGQAIVAQGLVGRGIERATEILRRHHLELAPRFSLLIKALATVETVGHTLDPEMDMVPIIRPYIEQIVSRRYSPLHVLLDARHNLGQIIKLGRQIPNDVHQLFQVLRRGKLKVQLNHEGLQRLAAVLDRASNRITFGVITGSLIIGSSLLITVQNAVGNLGLIGYLIAGVLGLSLMVSILRSRNL